MGGPLKGARARVSPNGGFPIDLEVPCHVLSLGAQEKGHYWPPLSVLGADHLPGTPGLCLTCGLSLGQ